MSSKRTLILKDRSRIIYSVKIDDEVLWEGENVHEVFPTLKESNNNRDLSIHWEVKKEPEIAK